jgi:sulfatase maturation enzyme AslB (radical SAM superfamily)
MMQFSVSNSCNLQCIMCDGTASSAIRAHREGRPPLPKAYHESFFDELRGFLPHLKCTRFLGGEPFLQRECFRIWDMMIQGGSHIPCHVITNGTQWNSRVERVLRELPVDITISIDGFSSEVVEDIRIGASHPTLMKNFRRFHAYSAANRRHFTLTFCLMRQNWHEFGRLCMFGDEWGCPVFVNTVRTPSHCSLYTLSDRELQRTVRAMEVEAAALLPRLRGNLEVWVGEFERLRTFLQRRRARASGGRVPGSSGTTTNRASVNDG